MTEPFDPAPAASVLAAAWHSGELLAELPAAIRPQTLAQGYDVQDRLAGLLAMPMVGWKMGVGSTLQKRQTGIGRGVAGRVFAPRLHRSGDTVRLESRAPVTVEFEIAYVLGRDIAPGEPAFPILEAVAEVRTTFELVLSRFVDRRSVGWPSFAADNAAFHALVVGETIDPARVNDLLDSLVVSVDGREAARRLTGDDMTDPATSLADLVAIARERGMTLPKGSIVSTGTASRVFDIAQPTALLRATFLGTEMTAQVRQ